MEDNTLYVAYKEDIMAAFGCTDYSALNLMKSTGRAFKIGKRFAISKDTFNSLLNGEFEKIETPEDYFYKQVEFR